MIILRLYIFLQTLHNVNSFITSFKKLEIEQFYGKSELKAPLFCLPIHSSFTPLPGRYILMTFDCKFLKWIYRPFSIHLHWYVYISRSFKNTWAFFFTWHYLEKKIYKPLFTHSHSSFTGCLAVHYYNLFCSKHIFFSLLNFMKQELNFYGFTSFQWINCMMSEGCWS